MVFLTSIFQNAGGYLKTIEITDILDIAIVAFLIYQLMRMVKSSNAAKIMKGIALVLAALLISKALELNALNYLLSIMVEWGVLALIILFQPEIRQILERVGGGRFSLRNVFGHTTEQTDIEKTVDLVVAACGEMSKTRTGALIVFERQMDLTDILRSGTRLDARVSVELLKNIFFVKAPMHDGAVLIRQDRVLGAGCMLPLSKNMNLSRDLGMRHRAGIGMSENSDAVVVLVSEETGSMSCAVGGMLKRHLTTETLRQLLRNELIPKQDEEEEEQKMTLRSLMKLLQSVRGGGKDER